MRGNKIDWAVFEGDSGFFFSRHSEKDEPARF